MFKAMTSTIILLIKFYQRTLSPDHGLVKIFFNHPVCRYMPTCSEYAIESLEKNGLKSLSAISKRILTCNPFFAGGFHPVTSSKQKNRS